MIVLKSRREIEKMRVAGRLVADALAMVAAAAAVGVTTEELDERAEEIIRNGGGIPAFKHYQPDFIKCGPFPATLCTSVNSEVVHGIPDGRPLEEGDLLSVDTGARVDGYFGDAAITVVIGNGNVEARLLTDVTRRALEAAIRMCRPENHLSDVSHAIQELVESEGYSVVRRFVGHGIGTSMHEDPPIPNYGELGKGPVLKPGMVLAIEPMVNVGTCDVDASPDYWRVCTRDGNLSAHFEHTIAITENSPDILTAAGGSSGSL